MVSARSRYFRCLVEKSDPDRVQPTYTRNLSITPVARSVAGQASSSASTFPLSLAKLIDSTINTRT